MYRNPWSSLRHRLQPRSGIAIGVFLLCFYVLYRYFPESLRASRAPERFPSESRFNTPILPQSVWDGRAEKVKEAFIHAYRGYQVFASPHDELMPVSDEEFDNFNGWGVSAFDGMDTMLLMGLDEQYQHALKLASSVQFTLRDLQFAPYFETVIRYMGGLLSAYALSPKDRILIDRAEELAKKLDPVFLSPSRLPLYSVNTDTGETHGQLHGTLAEIASLQVEYLYLAKLTGKRKYYERAANVMKHLNNADLHDTGGMLPITWNLTTGQPISAHVSVGARADSAHEYLLKQYLLTAKSDKRSLEMYLEMTAEIISELMYISPVRHVLYITDKRMRTSEVSHTFEHLSCFLPGLLALGVQELPLDDSKFLKTLNLDRSAKRWEKLRGFNLKDLHLWAAEGIAQTCWLTYADEPTGLGPEEVLFYSPDAKIYGARIGAFTRAKEGVLWIDALSSWKHSGARNVPPGVGDKVPVIYTDRERHRGTARSRDYAIKKTSYLLRPETLESFYVLWKVTGNAAWRERGWSIFQSINKETRTNSGFSSIGSVERSPANKIDQMPSYFLAETLKYLYLLFINDTPLPFDKWVFNTEAHPIPVFDWTEEERQEFDIAY
ncbi:glycoside hydrolase family 47 protein [Fistulina hepatica ATCC 64428]|uniref:alpha-1,2-Mannosidase n=1 Tax=Fistulina hepatica ATCC 64428 TaxID=1128425 RepID=A0A0D7ALW1_9AGAR|nr:glycoside hydrolase family 47 protein [Fistulina hepatica ATCC 64428]